MRILLIRHGIAEEFSPDGLDESRALSSEGITKMRQTASVLKSIVERVDCMASSNLVRAIQTAEILATALNPREKQQLEALAPDGSPPQVVNWLFSRDPGSTICLVGHLPSISFLSGLLLFGQLRAALEFKKGSAALIEFQGAPKAGAGELKWLLPPRVIAQ